MRFAKSWAVALLVTIAGLPFAEAGMSSVETSGFIDLYYSYNLNKPDSDTNVGSNFDFYHNSIGINLAELVFQKSASPVGFRIDLDFGETTDFIHCGAVSCPGGHPEAPYKNIQQAYISWATPHGITLDVGKFVTHLGAEVIETKDNWNYTRSLLFCCAIPYYHSGLRANLPISDQFSITGYLYNGWNNVVNDTNNSKTYGVQLSAAPVKRLPILFNWIGPEEGAGFDGKQVYDLIVTYNAADAWSFMLNYDHGRQDPLGGGASVSYAGIAAYAKWSMEPCAFAFRFEHVEDDDGVLFGSADNAVQEFTLTGEHKVAQNLLVRLEYRHDKADANIYEDDDPASFTDKQDRLVAGLTYTF